MMFNFTFYIDPGTGSMLFSVLIGLVSAGIYGLRSALIKLRFFAGGGRKEKLDDNLHAYTIFSDSKRYWNVFEPICDEFEKREVELTYLTASPDDPALDKEYKHVTCEFIGEGNKAFARLNLLKSDIVLSTTPGLDVFQWKRSRDVKWYAHILHAISDASLYRMFGIDYYDAMLLSGKFQEKQVRELERLRNLPAKECDIAGLTYMDAMKQRLDCSAPLESDQITVLLAPSWGKSAIFSLYGGRIIDALLATDFNIIVRPHPQSFTSEKELIEGLMERYPASEQLEWNQDNDNFEVLRRADIMISDFSGVIFDFALVFDKPVIYTEPAFDNAPYDACWLEEEPWTFTTLPKLGKQLTIANVDNIADLINDCITNDEFQQGRDEAREDCWQRRGDSAVAVADYLIAKHSELVAQVSEPGE